MLSIPDFPFYCLSPLNGSWSGDQTVFPNYLQFSCDPGFFLVGSSRRLCQANGNGMALKPRGIVSSDEIHEGS